MPPPASLENDKQRHGIHPHHPPHPSSTSRIFISRSPIRNSTMEFTHSTSSSVPDPDEETQPHAKPASTPTLPVVPQPRRQVSDFLKATQSSREEPNTFDESFRLALHHRPHHHAQPCSTQDGAIDTPTSHIQTFPHSYSEYEERTPLLNVLYNPTSNPPTPSTKTTRPNPLPPLAKAKPSLSISLWHEVCHNSQYTRPAAEVLREVLEVRYPLVGGGGNGEVDDEEALLGRGERVGGARRRKWRRWWRRS